MNPLQSIKNRIVYRTIKVVTPKFESAIDFIGRGFRGYKLSRIQAFANAHGKN